MIVARVVICRVRACVWRAVVRSPVGLRCGARRASAPVRAVPPGEGASPRPVCGQKAA